ncbi:uncharacterized protein LOC142358256 [Convolutriloba macropyga]|uniref:uncharacterized protein LOC142358256 n=1 Tax=Convolutriloba macropyga TaxID=536237 RepID=UPI003F526474
MWPRPPYSYTATVLRKFDTERISPIHEREVDYRALAQDLVAKMVEAVGGGEGREHNDEPGSPVSPVTPVTSAALRTWLLQRLMHEGPTPERDPELFKSLHNIVDIAEDHVIEGFFCRLCLSYHSAAGKVRCVELECGKCLCGRCAKEMVEGVLDGRVRVPVACPTGNCHAVLSPDLVQDIVSADDFERFQRMHSVKMSLDKSAPHKRDLASQLAQARQAGGGLVLPTVSERQQQRGPSSGGETDSRAPSPEESNQSTTKLTPPRVQTTEIGWASSSQVNHSAAMPRSPTGDGGGRLATHTGVAIENGPVPIDSPRSSPELSGLGHAALTRSRSGGSNSGSGGVCFANLLRPLTFDSQQADQQKKDH